MMGEAEIDNQPAPGHSPGKIPGSMEACQGPEQVCSTFLNPPCEQPLDYNWQVHQLWGVPVHPMLNHCQEIMCTLKAHLNLLPTRAVRRRVGELVPDLSYLRCGTEQETLAHMLNHCQEICTNEQHS